MPGNLFVFARITPKPEHFKDALQAIKAIMPSTLAEPGCHEFSLHEGEEDGRLYLYEHFEDDAALEAHHAKAYTRDVFEKYETWLAQPVEITKMRRL